MTALTQCRDGLWVEPPYPEWCPQPDCGLPVGPEPGVPLGLCTGRRARTLTRCRISGVPGWALGSTPSGVP
jgi:hypothetical protein